MTFSMQRPPGKPIKANIRTYPEDAPPENVIRCKIVFDYKLPDVYMRYLQRKDQHRAMRGTNIVHEWSLTDKGFLRLELRSGYFNGRAYNERSVLKKASSEMQSIGMEIAKMNAVVGRAEEAEFQRMTIEVMQSENLDLFGLIFGDRREATKLKKRVEEIMKELRSVQDEFTLYSMRASHDLLAMAEVAKEKETS